MKENIGKFKKAIFIFIIYFLLLSLYDIIFTVLTKNINNINIPIYVVYNILFGILLTSVCFLLKKIGAIITYIILLIIGFIYVLEISLFSCYQIFFPFDSIFNNVNNITLNYSDELKIVIKHNMPIAIIVLLISILIFIIVWKILCIKKINQKEQKGRINILSLLLLVISFVFIIFLPMHYVSKNNFTSNVLDTELKYAMINSFYDNKGTIDIETNEEDKLYDHILYNVSDINFKTLTENETNPSFKNIDTYVNEKIPTKRNKFSGILKDKNLIMICAEAFSDHVIDKDLTPTLYKLYTEGIMCKNFYVPSWGGSTTAGEYAFLTGLIPNKSSETMKATIGKNIFMTMPRFLKKEGYITAAFHNGNYTYYSRDLTHRPNIGFDSFYATGNGIENFTKAWPNDIELINDTIVKYLDKKPFCLYYMSMSGHAFYNDDNSLKARTYIDRVKARYGDTYPSQVNNYLCYQLFLEDALSKLLEILRNNGILDETAICLVSDHFPYGLTSEAFTNGENYMQILYDGYEDDDIERDKNAPIIWADNLKKFYDENERTILKPTSSIDLLPTLLNLYGIEYDSRLLSGRDIFSDAEGFVVYNNGSYITDRGKYSAKYKKFIYNDGAEENPEYIKNHEKEAKNEVLYSHFVMSDDFYDYIATNEITPLYERTKMRLDADKKVILKGDDLESYIEYFKECNRDYIKSKTYINNSRTKKEKTIYITIDDGPIAHMNELLDILKEKNIKATLFITGQNYPDIVKRAKKEGHTIAIHCDLHEYEVIYKDELSYFKDLYNIQKYLYDTLGEYIHMIRFPGGSRNKIALSNNQVMTKIIKTIKDVGFEYYDWNLSIVDSSYHAEPIEIYNNFVNGLESEVDEYTVLMHDLHEQTPLMLPYIIDYGIEKGYKFEQITDQTIPIHFN